ncbi:MAG: hypothetical protein LUG84_06045 [Akkermansiaceae bacterium]|nr:hypothetical protein [Akkermansiaceae bacterium]
MTSASLFTAMASICLLGAAEAHNPGVPAPVSNSHMKTNSSNMESVDLENEFLILTIQKAGRRLANVVLTDKINGLTWELGPRLFILKEEQLEEDTDKPTGKTRKISSDDLEACALQVEKISADPRGRRLADRSAGTKVRVPFATTAEGLNAVWSAEVREGHPYVRISLTLTPEHGEYPLREATLLRFPAPEARAEGSVKGVPVVAAGNRLFAGIEHPLGTNMVQKGRVVSKMVRRTNLPRRAPYTVSAVLGVSNPTQLRRTFQLGYLNEERARPYGAFLNYNTWYDSFFSRYDEKQVLDIVNAYGDELVKKRGVIVDSFLFDDGWDDTETLWQFNSGMPNEFREVRKAAESFGASPGVWFSPWGGYGKPRDARLKAADGKYETNERGFALAGPKYYQLFKEMCLHMIRENGVNHFKLDGTSGVEALIPGSRFASDFEAIINLIDELRTERPDLYVNLTTGTWASPFWFGIADSIWRGGWDHEFMGEGTRRNQWITFRDAMIYAHNVAVSPLFPINSLMTHGVIYTNLARGLQEAEGDDLDNEIWSGFGSGTQMQEIYITPSLLTPKQWDTLASAAKWARANNTTLVDSHWVGGDPARLEVYGWAAWSPEKGILTLRNPSSQPQKFSFDPAAVFELPSASASSYSLSSPKGDALPAPEIRAGSPVTVQLAPFQVIVLEARPIQ